MRDSGPAFDVALQSGDLFLGEGFEALPQGSANVPDRLFLAASVPECLLLNSAADVIEHSYSHEDDAECINDGDGLGLFTSDRIGVAAERIQGYKDANVMPWVKLLPCSSSQSA